MPNIVIREQDLSDVATIDITENAVFVPGVATWKDPDNLGTDNAPIKRFDNVEDFTNEYDAPKGEDDKLSYQYAHELIEAGVPVYFGNVTKLTDENLKTVIEKLKDKNAYNIKFITTGTYPIEIPASEDTAESEDTATIQNESSVPTTTSVNLFKTILEIAATRGDCIALVDVGKEKSLSAIQTALKAISDTDLENNYTITISGDKEDTKESTLKYGTIIAPWGTYSTKNYGDIELPGSFAYLTCLAKSTINYPNWYAVAGVNRGYINNLKQLKVAVTGSEADAVQTIKGISIVPITYINPYGYCIWGNRTLHKNDKDDLVASSFLNIRMLACDVKKTLYTAAKELMFETDSMQLWLDFKSKVTPLLDKMVSGNGLTDYSIKRVKSNMRATLKVVVTLYCVEAIENFDITLNITDSTVEVAE